MRASMMMVRVHHGVAAAACDQPAVHGKGRDPGDRESEREAAPEEGVPEPGVHRIGDDEEDGDWVAPTVPNPKCADVSGCGPWTQPKKKNPDYKGKWSAPLIDNPEYKGPWAPRKIKNPDFFEDKTPSNFEPIGAVSELKH
jgi:calnexin